MQQPFSIENWQKEILEKWSDKQAKPGLSEEVRNRLIAEFRGTLLLDEPLSRHTSMKVGGPADALLKPERLEDIQWVLKLAHENKVPVHFLGVGSNTLVKDGGIRGIVLQPGQALQEIKTISESETETLWEVGAGVSLTACIYQMRDQGLAGLEELVGVPASIGGAVWMNAGARGREMKDVIVAVNFLDAEGNLITVPREKLEFSYRHLHIPRAYLIISAVLRFQKANIEETAARVKEFQKKRADTQPLNFPNFGSTFKNPVPARKNEVTPSAGRLIEESGLKNVRVGGARVSEKHANFLVNENNAKAKDFIILIGLIRDRVKERTGVVLEPEVQIVGEDA